MSKLDSYEEILCFVPFQAITAYENSEDLSLYFGTFEYDSISDT